MTSRIGKKSNSFIACLNAGYQAYKSNHADDEDGSAADALGDVFNHTRDWTYKVLKGKTQFRAIDVPIWIRETGDYSILEWQCAQVGVIPVRVPECSGLGCTARTVREFAAYLEQLYDAREDGRTTQLEAAMIRKRGEAAIAAIHAEIAHSELEAQGPRTMLDAERAS